MSFFIDNFITRSQICHFINKLMTAWKFWKQASIHCGGGGCDAVFAVEQEMKIFSTIFWDFGKNMVVKWYLQHSALPVITGKNNEKLGSEIMKTIFRYLNIFWKNIFFAFNTCRVFRTLWRLKMLCCNMQMSIYFYTLFILITW